MNKKIKKLEPLPFSKVKINDKFWSPRLETNRKVTLPIEYQQCKQTGRIDAWKWKPGKPNQPHIFWDSDVAKWIEAASYSLNTNPDPDLEKKVDYAVNLIVQGQGKDGYLNSYFSLVAPEERWSNLRDKHELYCAGHLMEAAVAFFQATGKRSLLDTLCRYTDYIDRVFGPGKNQKHGYPGHEEIELALVKLYRETHEKRYLELAKFFIDQRGTQPHYFEVEAKARGDKPDDPHKHIYTQSHLPVRKQKEAVGHSVRAGYLYTGMADVAAETGDRSLLKACRDLWKNIVNKRMYITGGIGSTGSGERFTFDYDLPNETAYAETCAAISLVFFAHRMLQIDGNSHYADIMERALYNGVMSGVSLDGKHFFYANRLAVKPETVEPGIHCFPVERQEWFGCACCPTNITRLLTSLGEYIYSENKSEAWIHLYISGETEFIFDGQRVRLKQKTGYPWKEKVQISVNTEKTANFALNLRLPAWCRKPEIKINGKKISLKSIVNKGYAQLKRQWRNKDEVVLTLPMPVELVESHPRVRQNTGRVAIQRGPIVYCLEEIDNGKNLNQLVIPLNSKLKATYNSKLLGGTTVITGNAFRIKEKQWNNTLYKSAAKPKYQRCQIIAIPYCLWGNRRVGEMLVWYLTRQ